ncbi:hypothetical protein Saga11_25130 [Bacillus safensis]|nr:hypothetical protein Saga11_25130 [Bacillus safensis]
MLVVPITFFSIMLAMVLTSVDIPVEGIALILGIDSLLNMERTVVNIPGDAACAVIVTEIEKKHEKETSSPYLSM